MGASSLCGKEKGPGLLGWEWFYMFGLLRCMNGSEGLCVRNVPCLTTVVARLFWRILGGGLVCSTRFLGREKPERHMHSAKKKTL